jgi:hypothetical protein
LAGILLGAGDALSLSPKDADPNLSFSFTDPQAGDDEKRDFSLNATMLGCVLEAVG